MMSHKERREQRKLMARIVDDGATPGWVAERFGVSVSTVYRACFEFGSQKDDRSTSGFRILADLLKSDLSQSEIARKHGISRQRVHQVKIAAIDAGIKLVDRPVLAERRPKLYRS